LGGDPNQRRLDIYETTAFLEACHSASPEVVKLLLEYGADMRIRDNRDRGPYAMASLKNARVLEEWERGGKTPSLQQLAIKNGVEKWENVEKLRVPENLKEEIRREAMWGRKIKNINEELVSYFLSITILFDSFFEFSWVRLIPKKKESLQNTFIEIIEATTTKIKSQRS